jgi:non-specific serine/threonine protein kinase
VAAVFGVREERKRSLTASLADALHAKCLLLVLDNCEHLVEACAAVADALLRDCPELRILATSRQGLGIAGETTFRVPSLSLPSPLEAPTVPVPRAGEIRELVTVPSPGPEQNQLPTESEAVRLFVERAKAATPTFTLTDRNVEAVEQICWRLDGIPLAIELAAARVAVLSPEQIAARLGDRFGLLTGGSRTALPRYRTLRALLDWSHDLLGEGERVLLRRLAVFAGGWTLEAAEFVCAGDGLAPNEILDLLSGLVAKSLVLTVEHAVEIRYRFLETLREYAAEKLRETDEETVLRERHRDFIIALAERAEPELAGPRQVTWLQRLDKEHDNLRAALAWTVECGDLEGGVRLGAALLRFWLTRGFYSEGHCWLADLLVRSDTPPSSAPVARIHVRALQAAGRLAAKHGDHDAAHELIGKAVTVAHEHNDRAGLADGTHRLACLARVRGDYATARTLLLDALELFKELRDVQGIADTTVCLGVVANSQGDPGAARSCYEESLAIYRALGNQQGVAETLTNLGELALERGDLAEACTFEAESLALAREIGDRERVAIALAALGGVAAVQGQPERALRLAGAAMAIREAIGKSSPAAWRARFERWLEPARRALSAETTAAAWHEGRATPVEQTIEYALRPVGSAEATGTASERSPAGRHLSALTRREQEVAALIARGLTNRQIAAELVITTGTAANHVKHILARLGLDRRVQVAAWAIEHGQHLRSPS